MKELPKGVPLFRAEAIANRLNTLFGSVLLPQSRLVTWLAVLSLGFVGAIVALLVFGEYTGKVRVSGWLVHEPGDAKISSPRSGIVSVNVQDDQLVSAGYALAAISTARSSRMAADVEASILASLQSERESLLRQIKTENASSTSKREELRRSVTFIQSNLVRLRSSHSLASDRLAIAKAEVARLENAAMGGYISKAAVEKSQDTVLAAQLAVEEIEQRSLEVEARLNSNNAEIENAPRAAQQRLSELEENLSRLEQRMADAESLQDAILRAPIDGRITSIAVSSGQTIGAGEPVLVIIPTNASLRAQLLVPARAAGFVTNGMSVRIRYDAFPYQKFGQYDGTVLHMDKSVLLPGERATPFRFEEPVFLVRVQLDQASISRYGREFELRSGMTVTADILQDRRKIFEWLFEPLFGMVEKL